MSRKHFKTIAAEFKDLLDSCENEGEMDLLFCVAKRLCATFIELNGNFNRARFLSACGFEEK